MRKDITITVEPRDTRGKNEARRCASAASSPPSFTGSGTIPVAIAINPKEVTRFLKSASGHNTIFDIDIQGAKAPVMIVDWQHEPMKAVCCTSI